MKPFLCHLLQPLPDFLSCTQIRSIPAVMLFKQGELVETIVGAKPYEEFSSALAKYLA